MQTAGQVENRLKQLSKHGQSIWLDFIRRGFLRDGELKVLVEEDGLRGVTSNPSIFEKAIAGSDDYKEDLESMEFDRELDANAIYEKLAIEDIREALDVLKGVYTETAGRDGYVSMEVSPLIASDTEATVNEAVRLWTEIDRPNLMIKVPATEQGIPAVEELISRGINVNVTLLFSCAYYRRVAEAYMSGLEKLAASGGDLSTVASVASFFVSRIDSKVDNALEKVMEEAEEARHKNSAGHLKGKIAIANAKMAYQIYRELFTSERWKALVKDGARPQRLLWASTSTKNPDYPDTLYVDQLIGNETVNTIPLDTLNAFREHGVAEEALEKGVDEAKEQLHTLEELGISLESITDTLLEEGVEAFASSFRDLIDTVEEARLSRLPDFASNTEVVMPEGLARSVHQRLELLQQQNFVQRIWNKDASLWTDKDESNWLDWLDIVDEQLKENREIFETIASEVRKSSIEHVLLLGMGGSSLCPEVFSLTFGKQEQFPLLGILDSTSPEQIATVADGLDLKKTVFVVASKSGSTLEPNIFMAYFLDLMRKELGDAAGDYFVAITDPGSKLEQFAKDNGFKHTFYGKPQIGGRYSALSNFGMVPAALMGVDSVEFLERAKQMADSCSISSRLLSNPGLYLGTILGEAALAGRDKLTIATSSSLQDLGAWLEQLVAESTGKDGKAIIPVDREHLGTPDSYGADRLFVHVKLEGDDDSQKEEAISTLAEAGYPVVRITVKDKLDLGQEMFRFEFATAVAGALMEIDPFNQPDVEASKIATRALTKAYEEAGSFPPETPVLEEGELSVFIDERYRKEFPEEIQSLEELVGLHLRSIEAGDYFALLAYIEMDDTNEAKLQNIRHGVRDAKKVATCLGFGPRFLHSTGQAYKGGPNSGVFVQLTCDHEKDIAVPDHAYSFGIVVDAQARGDLEVLVERERRVLRVHLKDVQAGLNQLAKAFTSALTEAVEDAAEVDVEEETE